ncbi:MAG: transketolase [Chloroflexi bacterium]|uniref:Transketolase n=1 Tax=Candidatus Chlorohelix allophototropha TaxID=3003348 RepID=A0A8T7M7R4_9CHLR|nr:transketolase [Chloroflexota bacterium]
MDPKLEELAINTIRFLAVDGVQKANSGHPGAPLGLAPLTYLLWTRQMRYNPRNPHWHNRDRFILSNGHASMLNYAMLYLSGYDLPLEQLKQFRQWGSITPGHPEYGMTAGVETTTGPLGQGFGNGVGMGIAQKFLQATYNKPGHEIIDHYIYVIVGDGCLEEGVASEAASMAGHLELDNLIYFYDDNHITIEGDTKIAFTEDVGKRFEAYGWHVQHVSDINDVAAVEAAIEVAKQVKGKPHLINLRSIIGYGSPLANSAKAHGSPLGKDNVKATKEKLGWPLEPEFYVPEEALALYRQAIDNGAQLEAEWNKKWEAYKAAYPELAAQLETAWDNKLPEGWEEALPVFSSGSIPTRNASGTVLNAIAPKLPNFIGGSADLAESTITSLEHYAGFQPNAEKGGSYDGRTLHYGVREHGMGSAVNGATLYGGLRIYGATFFVFADYMRPSLRLAALMGIPSIFVFTHDSIGVGEDGPTHQPIEHLASLRLIHNLTVIRPADANETAQAWKVILERQHSPSCIILSRQKLPVLEPEKYPTANLAKGAYILSEAPSGTPQVILIATGSEVSLALKAQEQLTAAGVQARVVSMPSWEIYEEQSEEYKESVLPSDVTARLSIEAGSPMGWERYIGGEGASLAINHFGASAPGDIVAEHFGFNVPTVTELAQKLVSNPKEGRALAKKIMNQSFHPGGH